MLDRYVDRPDKKFRQGKYQILDEMCYAEFLSNYSLENLKTNEYSDSQPEILDNLLHSSKSVEQSDLPKSFPLMSSKESLKLRKDKCMLGIIFRIKRHSQKNMRITCFLCSFHLKMNQI